MQIHGLYAITPDTMPWPELVVRVRGALAGGTAMLQYRRKNRSREDSRSETTELRALCRTAGCLFIVNDDPALASACDADGVHLGRDDPAIEDARKTMGPGRLVGVSCYDELSRARSARDAGADYVAFGSFFASVVKPHAVRARPELLVRAKAELRCPVVAIGGITVENAADLVRAGADAVAVISDLFEAQDVAARARQYRELFDVPAGDPASVSPSTMPDPSP